MAQTGLNRAKVFGLYISPFVAFADEILVVNTANGAEKPSSQSARNVAQQSRLRRNLLFAGVFALLAMIYVPAPARPYQSAHYRFIFDQHETGIAFFQLLANVAFAALAGVLVAHAFRAIAKIPKRVIVVAGILAVVTGFALTVNYYRLNAESERQQGLYLYAAADYDRALFFGDLAAQCRREQAQMMERARLHVDTPDPWEQYQKATSPIPDWAKDPPSEKSKQVHSTDRANPFSDLIPKNNRAAMPSPAATPRPTPH